MMIQTKKRIFFFCVFGALISTTKAQQGTVAAGGDASGSGGSASYSIGQVDYITGTGAGGTATQGLQQPYEIYVMTGIEKTGIALSMSIYPNPTTEQVTLNVKDLSANGMSYTLSDAQGKLIKQDKLTGNETIISMVELHKATYIITVMDGTNTVKTFKIIKN
ncbi:MAG: hypothetical protein JWO44_631 [Bacteroidetes bacterium]|nr:hypothetical protein [Bacteroidota bacterium]